MKPRFTLLLLSLTVLWLTGCATNPVTGKTELAVVSESQEIAMGTEQFPYLIQMSGGEYNLDPALSQYVNEIGQKLARQSDRPQLPYEFVIVNDTSWNAWALPGGKIAINRGLLEGMRSESELAAVLAHEIVHSAARHSAQQMERGIGLHILLGSLLTAVGDEDQELAYELGSLGIGLGQLSYSRSAEREADYYGIVYMVNAGYDPQGAVDLHQLFSDEINSEGGWLSTHPGSSERVENNKRSAQAHMSKQGYMGTAEYRVRTRKLQDRASAYDLYEEGVKELEEGRTQQALALSLQARNRVPEEALFYGLSAMSYEKMGNQQAALQAWDQAIQRNSEWFFYYLQRAKLLEKLGERSKAKSDYRRSYDLLPTQEAERALRRL